MLCQRIYDVLIPDAPLPGMVLCHRKRNPSFACTIPSRRLLLIDYSPRQSPKERNDFYILISEKVLDFYAKWDPPPSPVFSNVHVLRPSKPEKMVFVNVSVYL